MVRASEKCLIDYADPPPPENELINVRPIIGGLEYRFKARRLPPWFKDKARSVGAMVDCDAAQNRPGRTVLIIKNDRNYY